MKKITLLATLAFVFLSTECLAGVTFIVDSPQHSSSNNNHGSGHTPGYTPPTPPAQSTETICHSQGYIRNSCPAGQYGVNICHEDSSYFKYCCPNENKFTPQECEEQGLVTGGINCHGLYACQQAE